MINKQQVNDESKRTHKNTTIHETMITAITTIRTIQLIPAITTKNKNNKLFAVWNICSAPCVSTPRRMLCSLGLTPSTDTPVPTWRCTATRTATRSASVVGEMQAADDPIEVKRFLPTWPRFHSTSLLLQAALHPTRCRR